MSSPVQTAEYLLCHREEEKNRAHWSGHHAEELWIQSVNISKLPGWLHAQIIDKLNKR